MTQKHPENKMTTHQASGKSKLKIFIENQLLKIRQKQYTCPFCREVLQGISEFGAHLKRHCT